MILYIQQGAMSTPVFSEPQMKLWGQELPPQKPEWFSL